MTPEEFEDFTTQFPTGLVIIKDGKPIHAAGYPLTPTENDIIALREELGTDKSIGLTHLTNYEVEIMDSTQWKKFLINFM